MEVPALSISSTGCRDRVLAGQPIWYLVPDGIVQYIAKRGLYHEPDGVNGSGGGRGALPANRLPDIDKITQDGLYD
jgi:nicotinate-nucleotide adenylyltransferase